ncbi:MAG: PH domain-containing protein, partial [Promethearchaeota archaeon]
MIALKEQLAANERVIDRFSPIMYQDTQYDCAVTNSRILLYQKDKPNGIEIDYPSITSISFEKELYNDLQFAGIIALFFGIMG